MLKVNNKDTRTPLDFSKYKAPLHVSGKVGDVVEKKLVSM